MPILCFIFCIIERIVVEYDNGEIENVAMGHVEPEDDFSPPTLGATLCVKSRGGKYAATVKDVIEEVCVNDCGN